ncbi:MAG: dUTP diphosphatase [Bacilli bacterium]|nr:dUTP diphosphatase [Bacilli bacterium]
MNFLQNVYEKNNELDEFFINKFNSDKDMFKKNKLELIVEIAEFANETKCFKYWTKKPINKELVLEEYADCIIMTLCLYHYYNLELSDLNYFIMDDINDTFGRLFNLSSTLYFTDNLDNLKEILFQLVNLTSKLNITEEELVDACLKKINKDTERLLNAD